MKVHVFDTYVKAKDGHTMHFDVITDTKDSQKAIEYAKQWLSTIGQQEVKVTSEECRFCHSESVPDEIEIEIMTSGFYIQKMEGCPS
jgi:nitrate/TMAO reductase-like tetraheme cytochrome c subunit